MNLLLFLSSVYLSVSACLFVCLESWSDDCVLQTVSDHVGLDNPLCHCPVSSVAIVRHIQFDGSYSTSVTVTNVAICGRLHLGHYANYVVIFLFAMCCSDSNKNFVVVIYAW